jgi:hypothetical protein
LLSTFYHGSFSVFEGGEGELKVKEVLVAILFVETIVLCIMGSFRFINNESTIALFIFNAFFISIIFHFHHFSFGRFLDKKNLRFNSGKPYWIFLELALLSLFLCWLRTLWSCIHHFIYSIFPFFKSDVGSALLVFQPKLSYQSKT